jgi:hypothetical protein
VRSTLLTFGGVPHPLARFQRISSVCTRELFQRKAFAFYFLFNLGFYHIISEAFSGWAKKKGLWVRRLMNVQRMSDSLFGWRQLL